MSLRSPLGRVLGLGAAKEGAGHWWSQRVSSVGLLLLAPWFVVALLGLGSLDHTAVLAWIGRPVNAILLVLLIGTMAYHSQLGVQVVVEDYVAHKGAKIATLLIVNFLHVVAAVLGIFAVLRIAFAGSA
jgi:succinate dehydrogenase / fumarate reductase, membrane anchor subunit